MFLLVKIKQFVYFCWEFNNSRIALIPAFHCVQSHLTLFSTQLFCGSDLSSRKVPLKVLEVGLRSDGCVPAADAEFFGFCMSPFSRALYFPIAFFSCQRAPNAQADMLHQNNTLVLSAQ